MTDRLLRDEVLIVVNSEPDTLNRVQFTSHWRGWGNGATYYGLRGQVFHSQLDKYRLTEKTKGITVAIVDQADPRLHRRALGEEWNVVRDPYPNYSRMRSEGHDGSMALLHKVDEKWTLYLDIDGARHEQQIGERHVTDVMEKATEITAELVAQRELGVER